MSALSIQRYRSGALNAPAQKRRANQHLNMVKALSFKGEKKPKKRKRADVATESGDSEQLSSAIASSNPEKVPVDDDSWVTAEATGDLVGPIVCVLPTDPPSCIACDTNGKVFASPLENIIDGDPSTAEPHDVRQVWVANRVAGRKNFTFKGHHGRQVICAIITIKSSLLTVPLGI